MLKFSKPYFEIAVCKALFDFLFDKCSFNLKYKSLALPIYCFPLTLFKKLYIPPFPILKKKKTKNWKIAFRKHGIFIL